MTRSTTELSGLCVMSPSEVSVHEDLPSSMPRLRYVGLGYRRAPLCKPKLSRTRACLALGLFACIQFDDEGSSALGLTFTMTMELEGTEHHFEPFEVSAPHIIYVALGLFIVVVRRRLAHF